MNIVCNHRRFQRWIHMVGTINFSSGLCSISTVRNKCGEDGQLGSMWVFFGTCRWRPNCAFIGHLKVKWAAVINHGGETESRSVVRLSALNHMDARVHWTEYWHRHRQYTINFLTSWSWGLWGATSNFQSARNNRERYPHGQIKVYTAIHPYGRRVGDFRHTNYVCTKKLSRLLSTPSLILLIILLSVAAVSSHTIKYSTNVVKTKYGPLRGIIVRTNPPVELYAGVPYASPPVGSLR